MLHISHISSTCPGYISAWTGGCRLQRDWSTRCLDLRNEVVILLRPGFERPVFEDTTKSPDLFRNLTHRNQVTTEC